MTRAHTIHGPATRVRTIRAHTIRAHTIRVRTIRVRTTRGCATLVLLHPATRGSATRAGVQGRGARQTGVGHPTPRPTSGLRQVTRGSTTTPAGRRRTGGIHGGTGRGGTGRQWTTAAIATSDRTEGHVGRRHRHPRPSTRSKSS